MFLVFSNFYGIDKDDTVQTFIYCFNASINTISNLSKHNDKLLIKYISIIGTSSIVFLVLIVFIIYQFKNNIKTIKCNKCNGLTYYCTDCNNTKIVLNKIECNNINCNNGGLYLSVCNKCKGNKSIQN